MRDGVKRVAFGTPLKGVLQQRSFLIKIPLRGIGGKAPNLNFDYNNFVIGSDTSGIQFPYGGIGAAFKCSFG